MNASLSVDTLKSRNLAAARALAAAGCAVFPCDPATGQPRAPWREESTTESGVLKQLWHRHPDSLPAIDLGKSGLLVLELRRSDSEESRGLHSLRQIDKAYGWTRTSLIVRSPDGLHLYFRQPEGEPLASDASLRDYGIVIRGNGGYSIGPGAVRADGGDWVKAGSADLLDALVQQSVPVVPDWFVALVRRARDLASDPADGARRPLADLFDWPAMAPSAPLRQTADPGADRLHQVAEAPDPAPWQTPDLSWLGSGRTAPPAFPLDALGDIWGRWCAAHGEARNAPVDYVASTLLAVTAAMIGNRRWPCASSEWREPPVLWVALVGAPSAGKSPAQEAVLDLVRAIERDTDARLLTAGTSPTALSRRIWDHPAGLLLYREEIGGWLGKFNRQGDGGEREMWLASYAGRPRALDHIEDSEPDNMRLTVGIVGSVAPDRLAQVVEGATDLAARFLWCWPEPAAGCTLARTPVDNARQRDALRRIFALEMASSEGEDYAPERLELSDAAADVFAAFARTMKERALAGFGVSSDLLRKAPGHCLRLAATLSFLDWSLAPGTEEPRALEREQVERAVRLVDSYFLPMGRRAFGEAFIPARDLHAMTLARWLREKRAASFNAREVRRQIPGRLREVANMHRACATLVEAGLIRKQPCARSMGRPRGDFEVNPALRSS